MNNDIAYHVQYTSLEDLRALLSTLETRLEQAKITSLYPPPGYKYPYERINTLEEQIAYVKRRIHARQGGDF